MLMVKSESSISLEHSEGVDRISSLPEPLHSRILSLLPTKNAVATSLLSTRWKFLWTSITSLSFDYEQAPNTYSGETLNMKRQKFTQFVNSVLVLLNPHPCIQNFHLRCHHKLCDPFYLQLWICAAIRRTVQMLELNLVLAKPMELPLSHFDCKTLTVLKLNKDIHFNVAASYSICFPNLLTLHLSSITFTITSNSSVSFPSLKDLLLDFVKYANEESVHKLFAGCPVLESLDFKIRYADNIRCLIIAVPFLQSLTIYFRCYGRHLATHQYKILIDTPELNYLELYDHSMSEYFILEKLSCLYRARVTFDFDRGLNVIEKKEVNICKFFGGFCNVSFLSITGHMLKVIGSMSNSITPIFCNLTWLEIRRYSCCDWSVVIENLLERIDNLEHLIMKGNRCRCSHESWWMKPLSVPMCLLRRVTTIFFTNIGDCSSEHELVGYFLENAKVLEVLTIESVGTVQTKFNLMQKILMIPRGSRACQVIFK